MLALIGILIQVKFKSSVPSAMKKQKQSNPPYKIDIVGIGFPKCGTTWTARVIAGHPEVDFSSEKEPNHFMPDGFRAHNPKSFAMLKHVKNPASYLKLFADNQLPKAEFSVYYAYSEQALRAIHAHNPDAKIVMCIRNPVDASYSHYNYYYNSSNNWAMKPQFIDEFNADTVYTERYAFSQYIQRVFDIFPAKNVHIIQQEDIREDARSVARNLYSFLGVDTKFYNDSFDDKIYETKALRFKALNTPVQLCVQILSKLNAQPLLGALYPMWAKIGKKKTKKPPLSQQDRREAYSLFKKDIKKTERLLGRDLSAWKPKA